MYYISWKNGYLLNNLLHNLLDMLQFFVYFFRGAYCAASAARLTNIVTPDLFDGTAEWIET